MFRNKSVINNEGNINEFSMRANKLNEEDLENVTGGAISFEPFQLYMKEHNITKYDLIKHGIPVDFDNLNQTHKFNMNLLDKICKEFDCQISDVIMYVPDEK